MSMTIVGAAIAAVAAAASVAPAVAAPSAETPISREQAGQRADFLFQALDLNHDGTLTVAEAMTAGAQLRARREATGIDVAPGIGGHTARYMEHKLAGAATVGRQQFRQALLSHFDQMDANHDGILTSEERGRQRARD